MAILHYSVGLLTAAYFARTESLASFWTGFGLDRKPSDYVWFGVTMALIIRGFGRFMVIHGWGHGVWDHDIIGFKQTTGLDRYFFLAPLLFLAPLFEESIYRGFLYKAFRGSHWMVTSMALIVGYTAYTHWSYYSHSWVAAFDLSVLTIVQCYLRENSDSLWDCILCHFAFNASLLFVGGTLR
jgi:membrane protease YdiL (CAAX protease family)